MMIMDHACDEKRFGIWRGMAKKMCRLEGRNGRKVPK